MTLLGNVRRLVCPRVPLTRPAITGIEEEVMLTIMRIGRTSLGEQVARLEKLVSEHVSVPYAIATSNNSAAMHLVVCGLGLRAGDEVITTPFGFLSSGYGLLYEGVQPVFVDVDLETGNIDLTDLEGAVTPKCKAIIVNHMLGNPVDMTAITDFAGRYGLFVIEDASEALGATVQGQPVGTFGDAGIFAFFSNKQLATGDGGIIITRLPDLAAFCQAERNQGKTQCEPWSEQRLLGYNYRLDELSAAFGCMQMRRWPVTLAKRAQAAERYTSLLSDLPKIMLPTVAQHSKPAWCAYYIRFPGQDQRDQAMHLLTEQGIECRSCFPSIHLQYYSQAKLGSYNGHFPISELLSNTALAIPFCADISTEEQCSVAAALRNIVFSYLPT